MLNDISKMELQSSYAVLVAETPSWFPIVMFWALDPTANNDNIVVRNNIEHLPTRAFAHLFPLREIKLR